MTEEEAPPSPWKAARLAWEAWTEAVKQDRDGPSMTTMALHEKYKAAREEAIRMHPKGAP